MWEFQGHNSPTVQSRPLDSVSPVPHDHPAGTVVKGIVYLASGNAAEPGRDLCSILEVGCENIRRGFVGRTCGSLSTVVIRCG